MTDRREERQSYYRRNHAKEQARNAVRTAKVRADKQGVPFDLTLEDVMVLGDVCALSGLPFEITNSPGHPCPYSPSLDRVKPQLGYVRGNIRLILNALNAMKGAGTDDDMRKIVNALVGAGFC